MENGVTPRELRVRLDERDKGLDERFRAQENAIRKAEDTMRDVLRGFPQEYAKRTEVEAITKDINFIRQDHVKRAEFDVVRSLQSKMIGAIILIAAGLPVITGLILHFIIK